MGRRRSATADLDWRPPSYHDNQRFAMTTRTLLRIAVSNPELAPSLKGFLEHSIYEPSAPEGDVVPVRTPEGLAPELARAELDLYLSAWRRLHPEASVSLVD
jgi:hypothetical protein